MSSLRWKLTRRLPVAIVLTMLGIIVAMITWQYTSLRGLPEIADPFDVAAFLRVQVRDEDNAYVFYRQAAAKYHIEHGVFPTEWTTATDTEKYWLEENREALDLWLRGTEKPDAFDVKRAELTFDTKLEVPETVRSLARLSLLECSRLESIGDYRGSWVWRRAALRSSQHLGRDGSLAERLMGISIHTHAANRITTWAKSPKVDAAMLRQALAEVQAIGAMACPGSVWVKSEYLVFMNSMERPDLRNAFINSLGNADGSGSRSRVALSHVQAFLKREPERSRRLIKLLVANWLLYCDRPKSERPTRPGTYQAFFIPESTTPESAQTLTPESLNSWLESTLILRALIPGYNASLVATDRERSRQATLVIDLASELYSRENGHAPAKPEDLVGPYLQALPRPE